MHTHAVASLSTPPAAYVELSAVVMYPSHLRDELLGALGLRRKNIITTPRGP